MWHWQRIFQRLDWLCTVHCYSAHQALQQYSTAVLVIPHYWLGSRVGIKSAVIMLTVLLLLSATLCNCIDFGTARVFSHLYNESIPVVKASVGRVYTGGADGQDSVIYRYHYPSNEVRVYIGTCVYIGQCNADPQLGPEISGLPSSFTDDRAPADYWRCHHHHYSGCFRVQYYSCQSIPLLPL